MSKLSVKRKPPAKRRNSSDPPPTVARVFAALNELAPFEHAAEWDNVGLLAGWMDAPAKKALLAIDLTDAVAREALNKGVDTLVVYHPPIFKGIRAVTNQADGPTNLLPDLLAARISIIALHTALDAAAGGTNDILLDVFDPVQRYPLEPLLRENRQYKLVVFVPPREVDGLRRALSAAGAGVIGHYAECSYELAGRGTFRGDETSSPTIGRKQVLEHVEETRLEMIVPRTRLGDVVRTLSAKHSYEEPAFDVYPLHEPVGRGEVGQGRVGLLKNSTRGVTLIKTLGERVDLSCALLVGNLKRRFRSVTAAAGAFGVRAFRDPDSLVLTGEFKHHNALELQRRGITVVHLGHYASERPVLDVVRRHLKQSVRGLRLEIARRDRAPFSPLRT
ncbi:MAG: Nif3-like dinuclear metal center hexameric protein [Phycisphaerae bacterium]|nr:Nif3-like dinuclear metal center hexameric protein [Phycisphaerae bacterium]